MSEIEGYVENNHAYMKYFAERGKNEYGNDEVVLRSAEPFDAATLSGIMQKKGCSAHEAYKYMSGAENVPNK